MVAAELGIPFLDTGTAPVVEHRRALLNLLADEQEKDEAFGVFQRALAAYWRGDAESVSRLINSYRPSGADHALTIAGNQQRLRELDHYGSAMIFYEGEWYWGIDRLLHLVDRLETSVTPKKVSAMSGLSGLRQTTSFALPAAVPEGARNLPDLDFYFSFRCPYSYLAMQRTFDIADAFGMQLNLKPVLPMDTLGSQVPASKMRYIAVDARREAQKKRIAFGNHAGPTEPGVERCSAGFYYAATQKLQREFMLKAAEAIWVQNLDLATDEGLRQVAERTGLFWPEFRDALQSSDWQLEVAANLAQLEAAGLWGVPSFFVGQQGFWGQDRDWLLAAWLAAECVGSDGIVV
jgi:2-hydroxychromene-2-carboxylate isomerase